MKNIPEFKTESEERNFWEENDSSDYFDWYKAEHASFPNLRATTESIYLRLPGSWPNQGRSE